VFDIAGKDDLQDMSRRLLIRLGSNTDLIKRVETVLVMVMYFYLQRAGAYPCGNDTEVIEGNAFCGVCVRLSACFHVV
jgi:hypothetical protein